MTLDYNYPLPSLSSSQDRQSAQHLPSLSEILPEFFPSSLKAEAIFMPLVERKPRPRRRFEEVKRLYPCTYPNCNKAYGALNHLNSHIVSKSHGKKRQSDEFEEMRRRLKTHSVSLTSFPFHF
ncbi:hypothetical protein DSO57_1023544 [Entomophthora muscae]|uniref:Uncharacterized protein n=1 Tax=Entomophthora muscae TaxID=34485 RepID=A0ACC2RTY2_9FUNG|nr:hypothetical protein DSO57_1023544 [Entomophthora muscae]